MGIRTIPSAIHNPPDVFIFQVYREISNIYLDSQGKIQIGTTMGMENFMKIRHCPAN